MDSVNPRRSYRSTIRRGDAPQAILTAATKLFRTKGYLAASIDDIAAEAGVARPTVFAAVGPKPTLLKLVVDYATTGDDTHIPVTERTWSREAQEAEDPAMSLRLHARNSRRICERVADLLRAVESAAAADADAAALWADLQEIHMRLKDDFDRGVALQGDTMHRDGQREGKTLAGPPPAAAPAPAAARREK